MQPPEINILYQDRQLLALNKPHGIVVEYEPHLRFTLEWQALQYLRSHEKYPQKCFIGVPHRLDRPVSGVVLFAKKKLALKQLVEKFARREMDKTYLAIVEKAPTQPAAELVNWLVKDTEQRKAIIHPSQVPGAMRVELHYKTLGQAAGKTLLEVKLITGKFHQIRAQLSYMGCPIVGDAHYGAATPYKENAIGLHARQLQLTHPETSELLTITAPVPDDEVWKAFAAFV